MRNEWQSVSLINKVVAEVVAKGMSSCLCLRDFFFFLSSYTGQRVLLYFGFTLTHRLEAIFYFIQLFALELSESVSVNFVLISRRVS